MLTNTVTKDDVELLKARGVRLLITTTPELNGRSFGTNVMEALLVALSEQGVAGLNPMEYEVMLDQLGFKPRIVELN